jgi:hypothetical protein
MDILGKFIKKYEHVTGWRKIGFWYRSLKSEMRTLGQVGKSGGKGKEERLLQAATDYLDTARLFLSKLKKEKPNLPLRNTRDFVLQPEPEYYQTGKSYFPF